MGTNHLYVVGNTFTSGFGTQFAGGKPACSWGDNVSPCPHYNDKQPETQAGSTTVGDGALDVDWQSATFGMPASVLRDRYPTLVPADINGVARGSTSDVGAMEHP